jgi:3-oxoacyl-[acyl-carrier-protein] synthase II
MFLVNNNKENSIARLIGIDTIHTSDTEIIKNKIESFIGKYLPGSETIDLFLSGENGDEQTLKYYTTIESVIDKNMPVVRFKHLCGEYSTASAYALWLACQLFQSQTIPSDLLKSNAAPLKINRILLYNNYAGTQHSFMLIEKVD